MKMTAQSIDTFNSYISKENCTFTMIFIKLHVSAESQNKRLKIAN